MRGGQMYTEGVTSVLIAPIIVNPQNVNKPVVQKTVVYSPKGPTR